MAKPRGQMLRCGRCPRMQTLGVDIELAISYEEAIRWSLLRPPSSADDV